MAVPTINESWIIEAGDTVIEKKARSGLDSLSPVERLIYCVWVADYGMRNAGDLETAQDVYASFQSDAAGLAAKLGLRITHNTFALSASELERLYFDKFDELCDKIRNYA